MSLEGAKRNYSGSTGTEGVTGGAGATFVLAVLLGDRFAFWLALLLVLTFVFLLAFEFELVLLLVLVLALFPPPNPNNIPLSPDPTVFNSPLTGNINDAPSLAVFKRGNPSFPTNPPTDPVSPVTVLKSESVTPAKPVNRFLKL